MVLTINDVDERELLVYSLDDVIKYIFEASVKLKCSILTRTKAFLIYHLFKRCVHETKYDPHLVAAACVALSIRHHEEPVKFDSIILVFFSLTQPGPCPNIRNMKFKLMKGSVTSVMFLIARMIEYSLTHEVAYEFLPHFMLEFYEEVLHFNAWETFAETCMRLCSDFYLSSKCLNYRAEEIASTVIQVALYFIGIEFSANCFLTIKIKDLCDLEEWKKHDIIQDIFEICDLGPVAEALKIQN